MNCRNRLSGKLQCPSSCSETINCSCKMQSVLFFKQCQKTENACSHKLHSYKCDIFSSWLLSPKSVVLHFNHHFHHSKLLLSSNNDLPLLSYRWNTKFPQQNIHSQEIYCRWQYYFTNPIYKLFNFYIIIIDNACSFFTFGLGIVLDASNAPAAVSYSSIVGYLQCTVIM